jgi:hypothetical protein
MASLIGPSITQASINKALLVYLIGLSIIQTSKDHIMISQSLIFKGGELLVRSSMP